MIGVAISTTGDEHRMGFLETSLRGWLAAVPKRTPVFVTVDGDDEDVRRVVDMVWAQFGGEQREGDLAVYRVADERLGVAANKNVGLELLMDAKVDDYFLSDDDVYPLGSEALGLHIAMREPHSMVCWGKGRLTGVGPWSALWSWPRGVVLYLRRSVVSSVGGMVEAFGPGGHEHVEFSRRIHQRGLTESLFPSPREYALAGAMGARRFWRAEDMPRPGEPVGNLRMRKIKHTSVRRKDGDWEKIEKIMKDQDGSTEFVPFRATANGRSYATLCWSLSSQGAEGEVK